ncbi:MAG: family 10 glycosylhydrolase, partial [Deltaproteobacteria bacterium]|nr:family 10 glycosylhydrolase [Deltaproteobacteria bacterium]
MPKFKILIVTYLILLLNLLSAAPKEEFRAVWLTTVWQSDWPSSYTVSSQQSELMQILDSLKAWHFNAVMFQVRPACDAFYSSSIEPWSNWLTGTEGTAPSPLYDPLQFLIDEAGERGLEVHAWFNPYRAKTGSAGTSPSHVFNTHPEWVLSVGSSSAPAFSKARDLSEKQALPASEATLSTTYILDPGMQAVREYILSVVADVASRYDIDGVHLDDYFYPYSGMSGEDAATFASESRGFTDIADWRRDNIHLLIESIHDTLQIIDPRIKFGVSPFGIWKSGVPPGITGTSAYDAIYCDALTWIEEQWVDYIAPQLYWPFGGGQDYGLLMPWWAGYANDNSRHLYVGHGAYKINDWPYDEIPRQVSLNRQTDASLGSIYFSYSDIAGNPKGSLDSLKNNYYNLAAVPPRMNWKDSLAAPAPKNVQRTPSGSDVIISWEPGDMTSAHDDAAHRYLVYKWPVSGSFNADDASQIASLIPASGTLSYTDGDHETYRFGVASQDRLSNQSDMIMAEGDHDLDLSFEDNGDVANWGSHNEGSVGTSCTWNSTGGVSNSGALNFTDPGWTFLIKRPLTADSQSSYTLTFYVKTEAWTHSSNTLNAYVTGLSLSEPQAVVSAYDTYTQVTLSGTADAGTSGYIRFHGLNNGYPTSLWIDNLSFTVTASDVPLPISLASFAARPVNGVVELAWETASETNNARFVIYRNGAAIGSDEGAGTTTEPQSYTFVDDAVVPG